MVRDSRIFLVKVRRRQQCADALLSKQGVDPQRLMRRQSERERIKSALAEVSAQWRGLQR